MKLDVFRRTLLDLRLSIVGWGIGIAVPSTAMLLFFPIMQGMQSMTELAEFLRTLPAPIQELIGDPEALGPEGFLRLKVFSRWLPLLLSSFAILQGSAVIAGERESKTIDILLAQPIARWRVVVEKAAAIGVAVVLVCVPVAAGLLTTAVAVPIEVDRGWIVLATFDAAPLAAVFGAAAILASVNVRRSRQALVLTVIPLAGSFLLETLAPLVEALRPWRPLTPLYYYAESMPVTGGFFPMQVAVLLAAAGVLMGMAVWIFQRRDLTI